jgi:hypothetical protein
MLHTSAFHAIVRRYNPMCRLALARPPL